MSCGPIIFVRRAHQGPTALIAGGMPLIGAEDAHRGMGAKTLHTGLKASYKE